MYMMIEEVYRRLNVPAEERETRPYRSAINKLIDRNQEQTPIFKQGCR